MSYLAERGTESQGFRLGELMELKLKSFSMQGSSRLVATCLLFISPVIVLLLLFAGGTGFPLTLLYAVVVMEGVVIAHWALSGIEPDGELRGRRLFKDLQLHGEKQG